MAASRIDAVGDRPLRVAIAGAGFVAPFHIRGWEAQPGIRVVAICALDTRQAEERARTYGIANVYSTVEEMLDTEEPDVLDICTPAAVHRQHIAAAAGRAVHVLCQKPLADSLDEARAIAREAARVRLMVHENFRFRPWYRELARLLRSGVIGEPFYCRSDGRMAGTVLTAAYPHRPWSIERQPYFAAAKPLLLVESVIHQIDCCRFLFGDASSVYARARRVSPHVAGEDLVTLLVTFSGLDAVIERSYASRGYGEPMASEAVAIEGTRGTLFLEREGTIRIEIDVPGERRSERYAFDADEAYPQSYADTIGHFVTCLRQGRPFETGVEDNLKTLEIVFGAYRSIRLNEVVQLPLQ